MDMWFKKKKQEQDIELEQATQEQSQEQSQEQLKGQLVERSSALTEAAQELIWMRRMISHNVRMPMSIIRGYGDVLRQNLLSEEDKQQAIGSICENIMYLDQIINVLFDGNEMNDGAESVVTRINISDVIQKTVGYVKEIARKKQIAIHLKLESDTMYIDAELTPIMRIFYQILENAFKYLETGNAITLLVHTAGDEVLIVYKDDGNGMNQEEVSKVFERGFRGGNGQGKHGTGIGLYDVAEIVKRYHGVIEGTSRQGEGFSIYIRFPKAKER